MFCLHTMFVDAGLLLWCCQQHNQKPRWHQFGSAALCWYHKLTAQHGASTWVNVIITGLNVLTIVFLCLFVTLASSVSPLPGHGAVLRFAAEQTEDAYALLQEALEPLEDILGASPYSNDYY
eukprot:TRINITY_DN10945_c0_g1_i2.p1 TRINITY_DN10945_c0_g1~~TRINITY_DN10945_c0_g1_i2.p1  ORF type:complete len:122 (-),score=7.64 TRINITY_DN10945_c0_g1_i2:3-368(-)